MHALASVGSYPVHGHEVSITPPGLAASFTTYPNPFNPATDEFATIGFSLPEDAEIGITVYSITGAVVRHLLERVARAAGAYSADQWDGRDDNGQPVVSGTYFCQIRAAIAGSREEIHRRKVAVLR